MDVTPRMKQIFQILLKEPGAIPVKTLAEYVGVSKRTVQRELEYAQYVLKPYGIAFRSKTGAGVWLEGAEEDKQRLFLEVTGESDYDSSNRENRRKRLILELLKEKGLKKLFYYSSRFGVSEATISADLDVIGEWLNQYGLYVNRKPGSGVSIEGGEDDYRRAIRAFIEENMDTQAVWEAYQDIGCAPNVYEALRRSSVGELLKDDIMSRVIDCITRIGNARVSEWTENSYAGLVIHISIAVNRILKGEVIEAGDDWQKPRERDEDYVLAEEIAAELEKEFEIIMPELETDYICLHIKGAKHEKIRWDGKQLTTVENRELQELLNAMIDAFDREKAYLLKQDDEFIQGFLAHMQPTMVRLIHGMTIQNPVLADIKNSYPDIYEKCGKVAQILEQHIGRHVPEEEIGYLTVHFGAALVRLEERKERIRKVRAGVVCSSGIGISRLLCSKLEKLFKDRLIVTAYGKRDITPFIAGGVDFFVASVPLDPADVPVIEVNPLLCEDDIRRIQHMVYKYERMPSKREHSDEFSVQLGEINLVAAQINTVIKYMDFFKVENRITFEELLIAIAERMSPYSDRREMIREDILRREKIATQVFAEFGFALLHTRTKGVVRPCFSVCMTRDLEEFLDPYFKEIRVVFVMLVPVDEKAAVNNEIMGYVSSMLIEDMEFMDTVLTGDKEEIRSFLSRSLKKYFQKYLAGLS